MTATFQPQPYRVLEASHLAASPLLESVNWLLDTVHHQHSAFSNVLDQLQQLQAFKEVTDETLKSMRDDLAGVASARQGLAEIAACYTKDVVERAGEASKSSKPGQERSEDMSAEIPKVVHEELNRMENELKEQIRELREALRTAPPAESVERAEVKTHETIETHQASQEIQEDARLMALELQISELKEKLDSVLPSSTTELAPSAPADVTPTVPDTDASLQAGSNEALPETTEVNGPVVVVSPAVVVSPPASTAAGPAGTATVHAAPPESVELVGRVKVLEGKVHSLTEALEVLRKSLDFPEDLAPAVAEGTSAEATPETASPVQPGEAPDGTAVAVQTSAPGSKSEVPSSGRGSRPASRENWKTLASTLESLDLRVTALEQWRATAEPDAAGDPAVIIAEAPEDAPVEPPQRTPEERRPSANEAKVPPLRLPGLPGPQQPALHLAQCVEGSEDLEERLSVLQEVHPLPPEQSSMLNSIVQDVRLCLKRCELILQLPEIKTFIRKFQSSLQVNAVLHDRWLGPGGPRHDDELSAPKIEQCKSMGDLTSVAADPCRPKRGELQKRPFRTVTDWARPHTPLTLDPQSGPKLPEI